LSQLKFATQNVDELRGQKLADTIPWLANILENIE